MVVLKYPYNGIKIKPTEIAFRWLAENRESLLSVVTPQGMLYTSYAPAAKIARYRMLMPAMGEYQWWVTCQSKSGEQKSPVWKFYRV
jgi:hypothetical protein